MERSLRGVMEQSLRGVMEPSRSHAVTVTASRAASHTPCDPCPGVLITGPDEGGYVPLSQEQSL